ncbi:MAG: phosphoribosylglycinamide formyltransferase [Acidobacteria bacterium]|nr:MAG: phosphoribosylglycinamide formyltransferase [Acidobacteriota bacterium]
MTKRVGVLVSGRGSNLQALLEAARAGRLGGEIAVVVSNVAAAPAVDKARAAGVPAVVCDHRGQPREEHDRAVLGVFREHGVDLVCLAGYMRLLSTLFLSALPHRVVNIHPSLLPAFPGLDAQRQAWEHGVKVSGATVHLVEEALDAGPIVMQEAVEVRPGDTSETLAARILEAEHRIYPRAVRLLLGGRWHVEGRRFVADAEPA